VRVLVDTNIVLDFLLQREPFSQDAKLLFQAIDVGEIVGYVTATTLTDIFYISRRHTRNIEKARQAVLGHLEKFKRYSSGCALRQFFET
jgi:predicted nucleic acid-binding protein